MPLFLVFVWVAIASLPASEIPHDKRPAVTESISEGDLSSPTFQIVPHGQRLRYRLDGLDPDWTEDRDEMNLVARFVNQSGDDIERVAFSVTRKNPGWDHKDPDQRLALRREVITTPPDATAVQIIITSSGSPQAIGTYTVKDLSITASGQSGSRVLMKNGMKPEWDQPGWNRSGTRPSMALENPDLPGELSLVDTDLSAHADWACPALPFSGAQLTLEWRESYNIGSGGLKSITYDRLPPGNYHFQAQDLDLFGNPEGQITTLNWVVPRPAWQTWWFWLLCLLAIALVIFFITRSAVQRRVRRAVRHTRLIENERLRIAMDLHDDIGTRLSQISLIGSHARMKTSDPKGKASFEQITKLTGELVGGLSETVWMLSPKNNDLESLIGFLCRLTSELCRIGQVRCRIDAGPVDEDIPITREFRHHFVLSVKEALNNALKHSQGNEIGLEIKLKDRQLSVTVRDDGIGFDSSKPQHGNGLESLRQRMLDLKGHFSVKSQKSGGVHILLIAPLKQEQY